MTKKARVIGIIILVAAAILFPFGFSDYHIFQLTTVYVYAIALLGLNLLLGYNGQFSLGHSAFYAIGTYTAAILISSLNVPYLLTIPIASIISFVAGFLIGFPALRLEGIYLAIATYGLAVITPSLLKYFEAWTGGTQGIVISLPPPYFLKQEQWLYFIVLINLLVLFWLGWNLVHSRPGRALIAIRENPLVAAILGINVSLYKTVVFGISAAYAGIAGALGAIVIQFAAPDIFTVSFALSFLVGLIIGGCASLSGCIYGALFILFIPNISQTVSKALPQVIYGILLIVVINLMPGGISSFIKKLTDMIKQKAL